MFNFNLNLHYGIKLVVFVSLFNVTFGEIKLTFNFILRFF
jgi:hypothetical protein